MAGLLAAMAVSLTPPKQFISLIILLRVFLQTPNQPSLAQYAFQYFPLD